MDLMNLYNSVADMREATIKMVAQQTEFMEKMAVIIAEVQKAQQQEQMSEEAAE